MLFGNVVPLKFSIPSIPKDANRRDCLSWSVLTAAHSAYWVAKKISKWATPDRYFVSFPYGLYDTYLLQYNRKYINKPTPFYVSYEGNNFKNNLYLPFTFDSDDFIACRKKFRHAEVGGFDEHKNRVKAVDAYTGRFFTHDFVFKDTKEENANVMEVPWYCDISSWSGLKNWLRSDFLLDKPPEFILSYHEWNLIGMDNE